MKSYTIYFSIFGKKMKTTIDASSESSAEKLLRDKITIHKIESADIFQTLMDIINDIK